MTEVVHKYALSLTDTTKHEMHLGARVIHFDTDPVGVLSLWAIVDPSRQTVTRRFCVLGTGNQKIHTAMEYLGTTKVGPYMWHLFEDRS